MPRNVFAPSLSVPLACVVLTLVSAGCGSSPPPPDLLVTAAPGIQTSESGAQATFTVQLSTGTGVGQYDELEFETTCP